jgi:uncharacterized phage protein (TIGR02218 family)
MRTGSAAKTLIEGNDFWFQADLLELTLVSGQVIYVTTWDQNITNDGDTFLTAGGEDDRPGMKRGLIRWAVGTEVSTFGLVFWINAPDQGFGGEEFATLAANGGLYGAQINFWRLVSATTGGFATADRVWLFSGDVTDISIDGNEIGITVQSQLAKLGVMLPKRKFQASCPYAFCDAACGLSAATYTTARTVSSVTDLSHITVSGSITNDYYKGGNIVFTSGNLIGVRRNVLGNTAGLVTLDAPLPAAPSVADDVDTMRGCAKTLAACTAYSNQTRFPGFPFATKGA